MTTGNDTERNVGDKERLPDIKTLTLKPHTSVFLNSWFAIQVHQNPRELERGFEARRLGFLFLKQLKLDMRENQLEIWRKPANQEK